MYAKIFSQIYDGTLCTNGPWEALVTFQQLLILADQEGNVDMTIPAISRRTTIPREIIERGIEALLLPDIESRTPTEGGRRIIPLSDGRAWGWKIVNYEKYRQIKREQDRRDYHREYYHKRKSSASTPTQHDSTSQPIAEAKAEAEAEAEAYTQASPVVKGKPSTQAECPHSEILRLWAQHMPAARQPAEWTPARQTLLRARWRESPKRQNLQWWDRFFAYVATSEFLTGKVHTPGRKPFEISLDWLLKSEHFLKTIEGGYHNEVSA